MSTLSVEQLTQDRRLALLRKLDWRVRHAADSVLTGDYRSAFRGKGMEFDQVVPYEFGDDVRDIDWNVTARLGEPYRKKFIEEREVTLLVVFQDSVSLQFGSAERTKRATLMELAVLLLLMGAANRDRTAVCYAGPDTSWWAPPVRGRGKIFAAASRLLATPGPSVTEPSPSVDDSGGLWKSLAHAVPRHSVCLWLGDFPPHTPAPSGWAVLSRRYQMLGFRVEDPWERELPHTGELTAYDPLSGEIALLHPEDRTQRRDHAVWVAERDRIFRSLFPDPRARATVSTSDDVFDALLRFLARRAGGLK